MKVAIEELYRLSKDRDLATPEIHAPNDFYGHASILKQYAEISPDYQIKAVIEHAPFVPWWSWDVDTAAPLPAMLVSGAFRYSILKKRCNKALFSIGPVLRYAPQFLNKHALSIEKSRIGKTLLAFPPHSSHRVDARYDVHEYCRKIEHIGKAFDTVMVCMYWKDVLTHTAETYMQHGFECVTAGHMYDVLFLPRLKSIIELATVAVTNSGGTQCCACLVMEKPIFILETEVHHIADNNQVLAEDNISPNSKESEIRKAEIMSAFKDIRQDISSEQIEIADKYWGISEFKTGAEIKSIFQITEDMWKKGRSYFVSSQNIMAEQSLDYLKSKEDEKALFVLEQAIAVNPDIPTLKYGQAVAQNRLGRIQDALNSLTSLLEVSPNHANGRLLLQKIRKESLEQRVIDDQADKDRSKLNKQPPLRFLNLGCGNKYHPDWVNVDFHSTGEGVIAHNLIENVPFEDNTFDVVYHSHLLEHFPKNRAMLFLKECSRVLDAGGIIRVAVPDLEQIAKHYLALLEKSIQGDEEAQKKYEWIMLELFDQMVRNVSGGEMEKYLKLDPVPAESFVHQRMGSFMMNIMEAVSRIKGGQPQNRPEKNHDNPLEIGRFRLSGEIHQWMYDRYSLGKLLQKAGFTKIKVCSANESSIPDFNTYLLDIDRDGSVRKADSLFMEGAK